MEPAPATAVVEENEEEASMAFTVVVAIAACVVAAAVYRFFLSPAKPPSSTPAGGGGGSKKPTVPTNSTGAKAALIKVQARLVIIHFIIIIFYTKYLRFDDVIALCTTICSRKTNFVRIHWKKGKEAASKEAEKGVPLRILWGSQTGTAEDFSSQLADEARKHGFAPRSTDLEDFSAVRPLAPPPQINHFHVFLQFII